MADGGLQVVDLPTDDYDASCYDFGLWVELSMVSPFGVAVRLRRGWSVEICTGIGGYIVPMDTPGEVTVLPRKFSDSEEVSVLPSNETRFAYRARRAGKANLKGTRLKYPVESLSEEEAKLRHADAEMIHVYSIVDQDGERRPAIFVWEREEDSDKEDPIALYWLKD